MVGDMSRVTLNFDLSKIPFVHFLPGSRPILTPKIKHVHITGSHLRAVTDADDDDDDDDARHHSITSRATYRLKVVFNLFLTVLCHFIPFICVMFVIVLCCFTVFMDTCYSAGIPVSDGDPGLKI